MNGNGYLRAGRQTAIGERARAIFERLSPRQRQYVLFGAIVTSGFGLLWLMFALQKQPADPATAAPARPGGVTNIGIMTPGQQVNPLDQWVGTAGNWSCAPRNWCESAPSMPCVSVACVFTVTLLMGRCARCGRCRPGPPEPRPGWPAPGWRPGQRCRRQ
jgi:hypothetical protein